jgi:ElaA protein
VAAAARGTGLAERLMRDALAVIGERPSVLDAQAHLEGFYARLGYVPTGPVFDDDGIPHVPMRRDPHGSAAVISVTERRRPV